MIIKLNRQETVEAYELAGQSIARWMNISGHYNNRIRSHFIGRLGEFACNKALKLAGFDTICHFCELCDEDKCDISVISSLGTNFRIEVKTWALEYWNDLGRCIAVNQYSRLLAKSDVIVFCIVEDPIPIIKQKEFDECLVSVNYWLPTADVVKAPQRLTGREGMRKVLNYQIDEKDLREWDELIKLLRGSL